MKMWRVSENKVKRRVGARQPALMTGKQARGETGQRTAHDVRCSREGGMGWVLCCRTKLSVMNKACLL